MSANPTQLADSLVVKRDGDDNVLTWTDVSGESGYPVFSHTSPFVLLTNLPAGTTTYRDEGAPANTKYLVTATVGGDGLTADEVNAGSVPGYSGVPEGEGSGGKKGFIPAVNPVLVLGLLALGALASRRRLK